MKLDIQGRRILFVILIMKMPFVLGEWVSTMVLYIYCINIFMVYISAAGTSHSLHNFYNAYS